MKFRTRIQPPAILTAVALLTVSCAGGMADMYVWPAGTSVSYEMTTDQAMSIEVPGGGEQAVDMSSSMDYSMKATGPRTFEITITDISESADTEVPAGMAPEMTELIGWVGNVTLNEQGEVVDATGLEGNAFIEFTGANVFMQQTLQSFFQILPEGSLKPGVEWVKEFGFPMNMFGIQLQFDFTDAYKCLEESSYEGTAAYKIGSTSTVSLAGGGDMEGNAMDFALSGTSEGTSYIATDTGMLLLTEALVKMGGGMSVGGMDLPMTMQMRITIKLKE